MVIDQNNTQVNSFTKGMNTDTSLDQVSNELYVFGQNIRITTNALLQALIDSNNTEGIVTPVAAPVSATVSFHEGSLVNALNIAPAVPNVTTTFSVIITEILATASIGDVGAVIVKYDNYYTIHPSQQDPVTNLYKANLWAIFRAEYNNGNVTLTRVFRSGKDYTTTKKRFSVVINKETSNLLKLYIADGEHEIMIVDLNGEDYYSDNSITVDELISNHLFPTGQVKITKQIYGQLKTQQLQYCYRFYKKNGIVSKLSIPTNKIQVIDSNHEKESGNAEDTNTSIGFKISIPHNSDMARVFDHVLVYRLSYIKPNENAEVNLIYDAEWTDKTSDISFDDTGKKDLQSLSIEEFSAMFSQDIVPQVIEQNQNYMFASNLLDKTVTRISEEEKNNFVANSYKNGAVYNPGVDYDGSLYNNSANGAYVGGTGPWISYKLITTPICVHTECVKDNVIPITTAPGSDVVTSEKKFSYLLSSGEKQESSYNTTNYFLDKNINVTKNQHNVYTDFSLSYDNILTSSLLRSLRRGETYRYGIVLYNKYGERSDAMFVADVKVPASKYFLPANVDQYSGDGSGGGGEGHGGSTQVTSSEEKNTIVYVGGNARATNEVNGEQFTITSSMPQKSADFVYLNSGDKFKISRNISISYQVRISETVEEFDGEGGNWYEVEVGFHYEWRTLTVEQWKEATGQDISISDSIVDGYGNLIYDSDELNQMIATGSQTTISSDIYLCPQVTEVSHEFYPSILNASSKSNPVLYNTPVRVEVNYKWTLLTTVDVPEERGSSDDSGGDIDPSTNKGLYANPIGVEFTVDFSSEAGQAFVNKYDIVGYLIVRCEKNFNYSKTIMQCAMARPLRQPMDNNNPRSWSPYYPTGFLSSQHTMYVINTSDNDSGVPFGNATSSGNNTLFQIFSPDITYLRNDSLSLLKQQLLSLFPVGYAYGNSISKDNERIGPSTSSPLSFDNNMFRINRADENQNYSNKIRRSYTFYDYFINYVRVNTGNKSVEIESITDTKNPTWEDGFSNHVLSGQDLRNAIKKYKSFETSIGNKSYVNWICSNMYDMRVASDSQAGYQDDKYQAFTHNGHTERDTSVKGWIGPGPACFLIKLDDDDTTFSSNATSDMSNGKNCLGTYLCNIQHAPVMYAGETEQEKQYDVYYGFGNYVSLNGMSATNRVFDGDTYILPYEFVSMFKAYDFNSTKDSLPSTQIVYYIAMESKINSFFDYGMNYRNTKAFNLQIEPGRITGVSSQDRPCNQYNPIYSDNNTSNDIFNARSIEDQSIVFPQRTMYSQLKTNGELIDNWMTFKAADFIDVDSRYGLITNLLTVSDTIYYWQNTAFGRFSVNERSLITDQNSNVIQLGQGGILQRNDYIDTVYGIRPQDFSAIAVAKDIYWIDILNKAVVTYKTGFRENTQTVTNYGEALNVQNIINKSISEDIPLIHYDVQNNELLCQMLNTDDSDYGSGDSSISKKQLIFNTKYNTATSLYNRDYIHAIILNNKLFGIGDTLGFGQFNYIESSTESTLLSPTILSFVVNKSPSNTKVYDNQQVVTLKRSYDPTFVTNYLKNKYYTFTTDIQDAFYGKINKERITDREGNVLYAVPRCNTKIVDKDNKEVLDPYYHETNGAYPMNNEYGRRIRGKWMRVDIRDDNPQYEFAISHILTKFRQSYS